jgi:hypothetical protein
MLRAAALLGSLILIGCTSEGPASQTSPTASTAASDAVPRLSGFSMAYDPGARKLVMFGATEGDFKPTTWTWDGGHWRQQHPATSPPAFSGSMAYDRASASLVLYGLGSDGSPQTWEWRAGTWVERHPAAAPPRFYLFSLGDNEDAGNVIAFGGCCAQNIAPSQTWSWDGSTWKRLQPNTMPIDRSGVNLVYDPAIQKLVLFGGYVQGSGNQSNDLWTWDGASWVREYPPGVIPSELATAAIGYDGVHRTLVLLARSGKFDEGTWTWDGRTWTAYSPSAMPPTRVYYQMAWDEATRQLVLFDEVSANESQTWIWTGTDWSRKS